MTTYTVLNNSGEVEARHISANYAASIVLYHDGCDFQIRLAAYGIEFELWTRQCVANVPWRRTVIYSRAHTLKAAEEEIYKKVIKAKWERHPVVMTDDEYDAMAAANAREEAQG